MKMEDQLTGRSFEISSNVFFAYDWKIQVPRQDMMKPFFRVWDPYSENLSDKSIP